MRALEVLAIGIAALAPALHGAVTPSPGITSFERGRGDVVLAVWLNGQGPFRFLLDTGSTNTSVSSRTAEAIRAPVVAKAPMGSVAGSRMTLVVRIDSLAVGPVHVDDVLASVVALSEIPGGDELDGVIGHDALGSLRYTIDFRARRVMWWSGADTKVRGCECAKVRGCEGARVRRCEGARVRKCERETLELQPSSGRFLIALPQQNSLLRLVPDTGAGSLLLFAPHDTLPVTRLPASATLTTMSGRTEVRLARLRELRVGALTLRDVPAVVAERDRSEPSEVDGLLPLDLFDRVTVDGPGKRLIVEKIQENGILMFF
jgi:predicted aspartyl protease